MSYSVSGKYQQRTGQEGPWTKCFLQPELIPALALKLRRYPGLGVTGQPSRSAAATCWWPLMAVCAAPPDGSGNVPPDGKEGGLKPLLPCGKGGRRRTAGSEMTKCCRRRLCGNALPPHWLMHKHSLHESGLDAIVCAGQRNTALGFSQHEAPRVSRNNVSHPRVGKCKLALPCNAAAMTGRTRSSLLSWCNAVRLWLSLYYMRTQIFSCLGDDVSMVVASGSLGI